jgi:transposase
MADDGQHHCSRSPKRRRRKRGQINEAFGRSKGGFTTKVHALCDALGNPVRFILTGGNASDYTQAVPLLHGFTAKVVMADKGYDSTALVHVIETMGAEAVIPPRSNRKTPRDYDANLYAERHKIECMFNKMKNFRRIATRYDKLACSFLSFVLIVGLYLWLK